jgi:hypothetical protein
MLAIHQFKVFAGSINLRASEIPRPSRAKMTPTAVETIKLSEVRFDLQNRKTLDRCERPRELPVELPLRG